MLPMPNKQIFQKLLKIDQNDRHKSQNGFLWTSPNSIFPLKVGYFLPKMVGIQFYKKKTVCRLYTIKGFHLKSLVT
jgi:hypothetical protein